MALPSLVLHIDQDGRADRVEVTDVMVDVMEILACMVGLSPGRVEPSRSGDMLPTQVDTLVGKVHD